MFEADWRTFDDTEVMAQRVASYVESLVRSAIAARGSATLALAGGKTPVPAFRELAEARLDWSDVTLLPTDDRLVAADDPLSNVGLIRQCFDRTGASIMALTDASDSDPVEAGMVASLNRPGGNATGVNLLVNELEAKRLGLLNQLVPGNGIIGALLNPQFPPAPRQAARARPAPSAGTR